MTCLQCQFFAVFDMMSMPCGSSSSRVSSSGTSCPADVYQQNRFLATQIAIDEAFIQVSILLRAPRAKRSADNTVYEFSVLLYK